MTIVLDGTSGITTPSYGGTDTAEYLVPVTAFKNRIINGAMMIDQRNSGASVSVSGGTSVFAVDRFKSFASGGGVYTAEQVEDAPTGFYQSLKLTVTTADSSIAAGDLYWTGQIVEGLNITDFGFGSAGASTVALSFWVKSSLTGTFSGSLNNGAYDRSYLFTYTISSANTWEQKTVTIAGDTSGTWLKTSGVGMFVILDLGTGSTYTNSTTGSWIAGGYQKATGSTNFIATLGATFYITGVQLEKGSTATSFDYRPYGTELALCQRYYITTEGAQSAIVNSGAYGNAFFPVSMRIAPTVTLSGSGTLTSYTISKLGFYMGGTVTSQYDYKASAEL